MNIAYRALFWFVVLTSAMSGVLMFLVKLPSMYRPDTYLIGPKQALAPGTGTTPFEVLATFVFGLVYTIPLPGTEKLAVFVWLCAR